MSGRRCTCRSTERGTYVPRKTTTFHLWTFRSTTALFPGIRETILGPSTDHGDIGRCRRFQPRLQDPIGGATFTQRCSWHPSRRVCQWRKRLHLRLDHHLHDKDCRRRRRHHLNLDQPRCWAACSDLTWWMRTLQKVMVFYSDLGV